MHSTKNLFWNVRHNCNLAIEFNGLVSKGVNRKIGPFYIYRNTSNSFITSFNFFSLFVIKTISIVDFPATHCWNILIKQIQSYNFSSWVKWRQLFFARIVDMKVWNGLVNVLPAINGTALLKNWSRKTIQKQ